MDCSTFRKLILEEICGTIRSSDKKALLQHLRSCRGCSAEKKEIDDMLEGVSQQESFEPGEAYWGSFNERVFSKISERPFKEGWMANVPVLMRIAAVCVIIALVLISIPLLSPFLTQKSQAPSGYEEQMQEALRAARVEEASDLVEKIVPFYQNESLYFKTLDPFLSTSKEKLDRTHASPDEFVPYSLIDELNDSEKEALRAQIESEMI